jgi:AcrR family transcriptional regulator
MATEAGSAEGGLPRSGRSISPRQEQVLDLLEGVFFRDGLNVTVRELARRAGCSRRTLYELAPSKEELFAYVFDRMRRRLRKAGLRAAAAESTPEKQIEAFVAAGLAVFKPANPAFMEAIDSYPPARRLLDLHLSLTQEFLVERMEEGIATGRFRDVHPELVAEALLAAVRRVTESRVLEANRVSAADALEELFRLVMHGLVKAPAEGREPWESIQKRAPSKWRSSAAAHDTGPG